MLSNTNFWKNKTLLVGNLHIAFWELCLTYAFKTFVAPIFLEPCGSSKINVYLYFICP
jgi:hypothetical protein